MVAMIASSQKGIWMTVLIVVLALNIFISTWHNPIAY